MSTKQRILDTALSMFNEQGERSVTTNHIAAQLEISPGNLYYHFNNKQAIIFDLFMAYEDRVSETLYVPDDRPLTLTDKFNYLKAVFSGLWEYRFIHRDMEHLLQADEALHARYRDFFRVCLRQVGKIYGGLRDAGMIAISDDEVDALALNTWIVVTSWFSFLRCNLLDENQNEISQQMLWSGIYQVFTLERPYLTDEFRDKIIELQTQISPKPAWLG